ncbi:Aste57867_19981 [Aphanomyces stellatus]|uniref:Aste57867_19981 protein n=1 Tax=Aphanomyces stellatus TaxID=120398 RepID=A0A485LEH3_9STRA|nr:hypothetical protein As57867_019915 [Aphanomyces stellatus]VFT96678.1 Aste57867_19981 [Aphanomyces stellatus]
MPPAAKATVPSKKTIQESFLGSNTRRAYKTYQTQFEAFLRLQKDGMDPCTAGTEECTDFLHHLYSQGKKARTIDQAKSALVAYFSGLGMNPNPAQDSVTRRYIVGLQKYKHNNVDEEKKAHPLTVQELSTLMNALATLHPFLGAMLLLLLAIGFLGCFRMREVLALRWNDVQLVTDDTCPCVCVGTRRQTSKKTPKYIAKLRSSGQNMGSTTFVFPSYTAPKTGVPRIDWNRSLDQVSVRKTLGDIVERTPDLPIGISLHSLRRGGSFYRVFVSKERRFNFRELMAWCRWSDAKTCCEYLSTQSISNEIDPRSLLRTGHGDSQVPWQADGATFGGLPFTVDDLGQVLAKNLREQVVVSHPAKKTSKQSSLDEFVVQKAIPTARSALEAWQQWFVADPANGLVCALKDYTKEMIRMDR